MVVSVVANGSPHVCRNCECILSQLSRLSQLCDIALDQINEKDEGDARAQRLETTESIRIRNLKV
jgi:hypothetical protein